MYPYNIFGEIDLYTVFYCMGILAAMVAFRLLADRLGFPVKLQNLSVIAAIGSVAAGYYSAILFQAFYNIGRNNGEIILDKSTGATFYGGLIGGAAAFLLIYFIAGHFLFSDKRHIAGFYGIADIVLCSVSLAHALGRIGCLMAGCCHGRRTDAWFGMEMWIDGTRQRVIPTQLFEAIFLFSLFAYLVWRLLRHKGYCLELYMCSYGVWRFLLEYLRGDDRGETVVSILTPSQLIAVLMVIGGIALIFVRKKLTAADKEPQGEKQHHDA